MQTCALTSAQPPLLHNAAVRVRTSNALAAADFHETLFLHGRHQLFLWILLSIWAGIGALLYVLLQVLDLVLQLVLKLLLL